MSDQVGQVGALSVSRCASICDACSNGNPQRCICMAGPTGYVTICFNHAAMLFLQASLDEAGSGLRAFGMPS